MVNSFADGAACIETNGKGRCEGLAASSRFSINLVLIC